MSQHDRYISPFSTRYASDEMQYIFSDDNKFRTWHRLWVALARAEMNQGLTNITPDMVAELEAHVDDINYEVAIEREKLVRHDVMSHVYAYGLQCPKAAGIIHLGATSCYVGDNTDIIILREAAQLVVKKAVQVVRNLSAFADRWKDTPCLGYTHLQPAQLTTVGKRAALWINELLMDIDELEFRLSRLQLLGSKGTTGTQASFLELFGGDEGKIQEMERLIADEMGFAGVVPVSGQTYSRKVDSYFLSALSGIAQSAMKFANDLRIAQSFEELEEPFEKHQIGSSAMPSPRIMMYFICNSFIVFSKASPPTMPRASYRPRPRSHRTRKTPVPQRRPPPSSLFPAVGIEESSGRNHAAGVGTYRILAMLMMSANTPAAVTLAPAP
mgnify:CR=1 FL=1